jgi:ATP-dependent Clp protease protease subunit
MKNFLIGLFIILSIIGGAVLSASAQPLSLSQSAQPKREILILGGINDAAAFSVVNQIRLLNAQGDSEITIRITSPGGSVYSGLQIYDAMKESNAPIKTVCEGYCMSMAAILLAAGDTREVGQNTTIMLHGISMGSDGGKLTEVENNLAEGQRLQEIIDNILSKHSHLSVEEVVDMESYDHYMSPVEAKELGLIDTIRKHVK